jgi:hypothetical protein
LIQVLCFWHRKAIEVAASVSWEAGQKSAASANVDDDAFDHYCGVKNRIFRAILDAPATHASDIACQLKAIVTEIKDLQTASIEEVLDVDDIAKLSADLTGATEVSYKKHVPALTRGRKLTRAGVLHRYHSFLVQELRLLSRSFYGDEKYAWHMVHCDRAVDVRCRGPKGGFDEGKLPQRARAVLGALKINTTEASEAVKATVKKRARGAA